MEILEAYEGPVSSGPVAKSPQKLRLTSIESSKKSLSRLINAALQPNANLPGIRTAIYGCNALVSVYKLDFERRLEELEEAVRAQNKQA